MAVTVVVGGQYGSEGKGKVLAHLAKRDNFGYCVRCGGPNSGHTVQLGDRHVALLQVPSAVVNPNTQLLTAPGAVVRTHTLLEELAICGIGPERYRIDYRTAIISDKDGDEEGARAFDSICGSTKSGTGIGVARRVMRDDTHRRAEDIRELRPFTTDVVREIGVALDIGKSVLVEGTQGFGLSVYHAHKFPFHTSRDTTACGFLSECGIGPRVVQDVIMVLRTFPIRVGGNSGPLPNECTWADIQQISGCPTLRQEFTSVTNRLRRVGGFDYDMVREAVWANRPTQIALFGADYLSWSDFGQQNYEDLSDATHSRVEGIETAFNVPVTMIGVGPGQDQLIDRRS